MSVIFILIPLSIVIAAGFLFAFVWAVKSGQYEDVCTPSLRVLIEETLPASVQGSGQTRLSGAPRGNSVAPRITSGTAHLKPADAHELTNLNSIHPS